LQPVSQADCSLLVLIVPDINRHACRAISSCACAAPRDRAGAAVSVYLFVAIDIRTQALVRVVGDAFAACLGFYEGMADRDTFARPQGQVVLDAEAIAAA
jgi:hypothetical protein